MKLRKARAVTLTIFNVIGNAKKIEFINLLSMIPEKSMSGESAKVILVVDDEIEIRRLIAVVLKRHGYQVLEADDGAKAISVWDAQNGKVDLLVTDLLLPVQSGQELAILLRAQEPTLAVIFVSGNIRSEILDTTQMVKNSKFLMKPFSTTELLDVVVKTIGVPTKSV